MKESPLNREDFRQKRLKEVEGEEGVEWLTARGGRVEGLLVERSGFWTADGRFGRLVGFGKGLREGAGERDCGWLAREGDDGVFGEEEGWVLRDGEGDAGERG